MAFRSSRKLTALSLQFTLASALLFTGFCFSSCATHSYTRNQEVLKTLPKTELSSVDYAYQRMLDAGISKKFADQVKASYLKKESDASNRDKIVSLNIFGFLAHGNYSLHYSKSAVKKTKAFVHKYGKTLKLAEKRYHVSKESIAALLWVETKFGKYTGSYKLSDVYFSLLQASHPSVVAITLQELNDRKPAAIQANPKFTEEFLEQKVVDRSIQKSAWALDQLKAIDGLYLKGHDHLLNMKASYAGAFGFPQFIPTTYADYAISCNEQDADLYNMRDAILSVAHYLKEKGWDEKKPAAKSDALFEYNRSRDYGDVILKIAGEVQSKKKS
jgi:membrane-bound lytic murein transglycosylase B